MVMVAQKYGYAIMVYFVMYILLQYNHKEKKKGKNDFSRY